VRLLLSSQSIVNVQGIATVRRDNCELVPKMVATSQSKAVLNNPRHWALLAAELFALLPSTGH
jgi:hypothetical protein